jgi:hypothetical protein
MKVFILSMDGAVAECFDSMEKVDSFLKEELFVEDGIEALEELEMDDIVLDVVEVK